MNNTFKPVGLAGFKSAKPENSFEQLPAGWHHVRISRAIPTNDRRTSPTDGEEKPAEDYEWKDKLEQLAVTFVAVHGDGAVTHRLSLWGFKKHSKIMVSEPELAEVCLPAARDYAVHEETGERIPDETATAACMNIMNSMFASCKKETENGFEPLPLGSSYEQLAGCQLEVKVEYKTYMGKDRPEVTAYRKFSEVATKAPAEKAEQPTDY